MAVLSLVMHIYKPQLMIKPLVSELYNKLYVFYRRSSVGTFIRQPTEGGKSKVPGPKLDYRSMVSVDDMPELFVSFDSEYHHYI